MLVIIAFVSLMVGLILTANCVAGQVALLIFAITVLPGVIGVYMSGLD